MRQLLSDPSTYPLIGILGFTVSLAGASGVHTLLYNKDVQVSPRKRHSIMRYWGQEDVPGAELSIARRLTKRSHNKVYNGPEGMGINHDEWIKEKKKYMAKTKIE